MKNLSGRVTVDIKSKPKKLHAIDTLHPQSHHRHPIPISPVIPPLRLIEPDDSHTLFPA